MDKAELNAELYPLPLVVHSSMKWSTHLAFLFMSIMFTGFLFIPIDGIQGILCRLFFAAFSLFSLVTWLYYGVLKKPYISVDEERVKVKTLFGQKSILWRDVAGVNTYVQGYNTGIGVVTKQKRERLQKKGDLYLLFSSPFSLSITRTMYFSTDMEKLYATMFSVWRRAVENEPKGSDGDQTTGEKAENRSNRRALLFALIASVLFAIAYGISLVLLQSNYIVIPFLGGMLIYYVFHRHHSSDSLPARLLLGLISAFQILAGLFIYLMIYYDTYIVYFGFGYTASFCFKIMTQYSSDFLITYLLAAALFLFGALSGLSFRFTRKITKLFLKERNGYTLKKDKRTLSVYFIDYADFDDRGDKYALRLAPNTCLIEKSGHTLLAFYLPAELVEESRMYQEKLVKISFGGQKYYKVDLGGDGEPKPYGYDCVVFSNSEKQLELLQLTVD